MLYIFNFFTTWVALLVLFHTYVNTYISLPFLSYIVMVVGLYFSYVNPRQFTIYNDNKKVVIKDPHKFLFVDLPFHLLMFFFIYKVYGLHNKPDVKIIAALLLIALYTIVIDPSKIYEVDFLEIVTVFVLAIISYIILCKFMIK